jgi:ParB-like chromosome segregation protein Spo0J
MSEFLVVWWPIDRPIPYARNSRKISQRSIDNVAASIQELGFRQCIVVDKDGVIVVGHTRWLAAKKLGLREVVQVEISIESCALMPPGPDAVSRLLDGCAPILK